MASTTARAALYALAEATDALADPDRRAWHLAQAAPGPDEDVAGELERSAGRAQARGGLAAAAAFLERAATLTPDPGRRAGRLLAAAQAKRDAGTPDAALSLLAEAETRPMDELQTAMVERLHGQIAFDQRRGTDAARLLLSAARRLEPVDARLAREAHLESLMAAYWVGPHDALGPLTQAAQAARAAVPGPNPPRPVDVLLDAFALWFMGQRDGSSGSHLTQALELLLALDVSHDEADRWAWLTAGTAINLIGLELCDSESWYALTTAQVRFALLSSGETADSAYRESISHLGRTRMRSEVARGHLLYGEWLRREDRRADAREQLRAAHDMLSAMGMEAFADRAAQRELAATGEKPLKRGAETAATLTEQEACIAGLARDGRTNPEIGAQLFLSARTVEWHLRKIYTKLGIGSRRDLHAALGPPEYDGEPA